MNMNKSGDTAKVVQQGRHMSAQQRYDNHRSSTSTNFGAKKMIMISKPKSRSSYFSMESMLVLGGLAASLLILPLILPPLPPPPLMLLMLPICILVVLMLLAFMPSSMLPARHKVIV
ncbi:hypothetical protein R6Q57_010170 [Mikania cordata]